MDGFVFLYTMKLTFLWSFLLLLAVKGFSQKKVREQLYSSYLKDSISIEVLIPEDMDISEKHPAIYTLSYGVMDGEYLAAQIRYFRRLHYNLPNTLVVNIKAGQEQMGYSYTTGMLAPRGLQLVECIKKEIIPFITKKYNTSAFRTYIGHSQAASYGNYLFLHEPDLFSGYILLAPEKIGPENPPFHLDHTVRNNTFYYVAVGENDMQRRREYAREIENEVKQLDSTRFHFCYDSIPRGDHNNILTMAIDPALKHIYQFYAPVQNEKSSVMENLHLMVKNIKDNYDLEPERSNPIIYGNYAMMAAMKKDTAGLLSVLDYFYNNQLKGWKIMQFGDFCGWLGLTEKSVYYYTKAIDKILQEEMNSPLGPPNLQACYTNMAFIVPAQGWEYLQKALRLSGNKYIPEDGSAYYNLGKFAALHHYKPAEGVQYLLSYVRMQGGKADDDKASLYLGRNYYWLKDMLNAKHYLQQALALNPKSKEAQRWLQELDVR